MSYKKIIDVSKHNGTIDFKKVKADGIAAVIIRAGYGKNNIDVKFKANIEGAIAAGLPVGIYWFSYAYGEAMAAKEAEYCLAAIKPYKITLPVFFDWEYDSMTYAKKNGVTPTKSGITAMTKAFCNKVKAAGYKAGYYLNQDYKKNHYNVSQLGDFVEWYARYGASMNTTGAAIWQYSDTGRVSGISGNVDMNYLIDEKLLGSGTSSTPAKETKGGTVTVTLNTLKKGSKGNEVKSLQVLLIHKFGISCGAAGSDGDFGPGTLLAVKRFQEKKKLSADGIVGAKTWAALLD